MSTRRARLVLPVTLTTALTAIAVARGDEGTRLPTTTTPAASTPAVVFADRGFDWGDAGIGAAGALGLATGLAGLVAIRRTGSRHGP